MQSENINILIVDDHPYIIQGYKNVINLYPKKNIHFTFVDASDCKTGYYAIKNALFDYDIALLDISMPIYEEKEIYSGEDLAKVLMKEMPNCKIVLLTMHDESIKVLSILKEIDPIGLIIKNDLDYHEMTLAMKTILKGDKYYSDAIITFLNNLQNEKIYVDVLDREILHFLNKGVKSEDIALYIPLSSSSVKTRKERMKALLGMEESTDEEFIKVAKSKGMLQ